MNDTPGPKKSALSRTFSEAGKTLQIEIYADGKGGWLLELIDAHANSTQWEDAFKTEQEALDEGLAAIREEGIDVFIGPAGGYGM
jgi:predicted YcjX-like family ATPase